MQEGQLSFGALAVRFGIWKSSAQPYKAFTGTPAWLVPLDGEEAPSQAASNHHKTGARYVPGKYLSIRPHRSETASNGQPKPSPAAKGRGRLTPDLGFMASQPKKKQRKTGDAISWNPGFKSRGVLSNLKRQILHKRSPTGRNTPEGVPGMSERQATLPH